MFMILESANKYVYLVPSLILYITFIRHTGIEPNVIYSMLVCQPVQPLKPSFGLCVGVGGDSLSSLDSYPLPPPPLPHSPLKH
jgi:hypothetical protein